MITVIDVGSINLLMMKAHLDSGLDLAGRK